MMVLVLALLWEAIPRWCVGVLGVPFLAGGLMPFWLSLSRFCGGTGAGCGSILGLKSRMFVPVSWHGFCYHRGARKR